MKGKWLDRKGRFPAVLLVLMAISACSPASAPAPTEIDPALVELLRGVPKSVLADPLLVESVNGRANEVRRMLEQGRDVDAIPTLDQVLVLVVHGDQCAAEVVTALVEGGANPDLVQQDTGKSLLLAAAGSGAADCFRTLLALGADPTRMDANGRGVVFEAYLSGDMPFFHWVLASNEVAPRRPEDISQALLAALRKQDWKSCGLLLEAGAELPMDGGLQGAAPTPQDLASLERCR